MNRGLVTAAAIAAAGGAHPSPALAVTISDGHVDAGSARVEGGRLKAYVKDASGGAVRWRRSSDVTMRVVDRARVRLPRDGGLSFAGAAGSVVWLIPQTQKRGVIWAGWNTERIGSRQVRGGVRWTLRRVSGPGRVAVWQTGSFGSSDVWFKSGSGPKSRLVPNGTHAHTNWSFTRRGTYRLSFRVTATSRSGRALRTTQSLRFRVG